MPAVRSFIVLPALPEPLEDLERIARNMFWTWNPDFVGLFKRIDAKLWELCGHNPVKFLGSVSQHRLETLAENQGFLCEVQHAVEKLDNYLSRPTWFEKVAGKADKTIIAYFSAEFGINECLPIYSGGLGILAGDHLKSASDLGVPLVGVGLLYQKGYFRQYLNVDGWQQEVYIDNDFYNIPVEPVYDKSGQPLTISVEYPHGDVFAQVWLVRVGRVKLYLLDTNITANLQQDRTITANLYGGDLEMRIRQEIMLGIGGLRALFSMGIKPTVCHMNEGHAAFMALERIRQIRLEKDIAFGEALEATKAGNVFTVHTPVKAGNDEFPTAMMEKYLGGYLPSMGITTKEFLKLGRVSPDNENELFKMPVLAIKLSSYRNGVSKQHGKVSRKMWSGLWPSVPENEIPISSITNGTHIKSWLSEEMITLYERYLGPAWGDGFIDKPVWQNVDQIPDEELWRRHQRCKERLVAFARNRLKAQMQRRGTYHTELNWAEEVLDPEALTIGFARRFATYKRGNLLLKDPKRLIRMLANKERPVQIIYAGKAHPRDQEGKDVIRQIIHFANQYEVRRRIVFLEDYDINVARRLVQGVDVWLNNPRPPMEASGTSGMKAAFNGALNMSVWDGWWCEGYTPEGGWVIGSGETYEDPVYQDMVESQAVYNMLENEVIPLFYTRAADHLPRGWIRRMKTTIKWVTPKFNTSRMVSEYTKKFYNPAAAKWQYLTADNMARAEAFSTWKTNLRNIWKEVGIEDVEVKVTNNGQNIQMDSPKPQLKVGSKLVITALVKLAENIGLKDVSVQLYYGAVDTWGNITDSSSVEMGFKEKAGPNGEHLFAGEMTCENSGRQGAIVRVLPNHPDLVNPFELGLILWENASLKKPELVK
ncbi:MAG: alpha-glucan family phosphorylase [Planctomycetota bacterium]|jgi:starch phosphorylase